MAKKSSFKKIASIKDTEGSGFGDYKEYNGGGSPKGGIWGGKNGRVGWQERVDAGEVGEGESRQSQPRTADGKFSYNSLNGKETKYESRGKTVNPLLTGGVNGIKIDDVKSEFAAKSGSYWDKYKDKWYQKGSEKVMEDTKGKLKTKISKEDIWELARKSFDIKKGEFGGESEVFSEVKKGRESASEKTAKKFAKKQKSEAYVIEPATGGIKVKGEGALKDMSSKLKKMTDASANLKHTPAQIQSVRDLASKQGLDLSGYTDEQIDAIVDEYIAF